MANRNQCAPARAAGAVLITVLSVMLALMIVGVAAARLALDDERSARHERDRQLAFHTAQMAQRDSLVGLGDLVQEPGSPADPAPWLSSDLSDASATLPFGVLSHAVMATGDGALPVRPPGFLVELLPLPTGAAKADYYRVTSVGFGTHPTTYVVLQSVVRVTTGGKKALLSWREVGNWREQHEALK
jgi:type IV pilus assembly protein PilX